MRFVIALTVIAGSLFAQSFEVTSVKVNKSGSGMWSFSGLTGGRLTATNVTMRYLLQTAWGLREQQIVGPAWIDSDRFDLAAASPPGIPDTEIKPLLQTLLKDRFHLSTHFGKRAMPVYQLTIAKGGAKMKPFEASTPPKNPGRMQGAYSTLSGALTMAGLADALSGPSGRPVIDKTGLQGRYFYAIQFRPVSTSPDPDQAPDIFGAVEQQLGLKLEPGKAELDALVVDHVERTPTEN